MNIQLTPEQIKNLLVLLNRVQIQGNEAEVVLELKTILTKALEAQDNPVKIKQDK